MSKQTDVLNSMENKLLDKLQTSIELENSIQIVKIILTNRKTIGEPCDRKSYCPECSDVLLKKILPLVESGEQITFVIPAFPFPMQNSKKTFGIHLPDHAELLSLKHLKNICDSIKGIYKPGAKIIIAADGDVFVPVQSHWFPMEEDVPAKYIEGLKQIISLIEAENELEIWSLRDAYNYKNINKCRDQLLEDYPVSIDETRVQIKTPNTIQHLGYIGLKRYLASDGFDSPVGSKLSVKAVKRTSGELAVQSTQLAEAWSHCIEKNFPNAVRLSVHPYPAHFEGKTGIHITGTKEEWITPWHGVAVYYSMTGEWEIMKNYKAVELGGKLIHNADGHPDYYIVDSVPSKVERH